MHPRTVRCSTMKTAKATLSLVLLLAPLVASAQSSAAGPLQTGGQPAPSLSPQPLKLTQTPSPDTFNGSAMIDKPVAGIVSLSILDAINRGLRHNLGLLLSQQQSAAARAQHRRTLSALLPNINGNASDGVNQINLAAFGIPLPPGLTSPVIGPFGLMDLHASLSETLVDFSALNRVRAAAE